MNPWKERIIEAMLKADAAYFHRAASLYNLAGNGYLKHEGIDQALKELVAEGRLVESSWGYCFRHPLQEPFVSQNWVEVQQIGSPYRIQMDTISGRYRHFYVGALLSGISGDVSAVTRPTDQETWHDGWPPPSDKG